MGSGLGLPQSEVLTMLVSAGLMVVTAVACEANGSMRATEAAELEGSVASAFRSFRAGGYGTDPMA